MSLWGLDWGGGGDPIDSLAEAEIPPRRGGGGSISFRARPPFVSGCRNPYLSVPSHKAHWPYQGPLPQRPPLLPLPRPSSDVVQGSHPTEVVMCFSPLKCPLENFQDPGHNRLGKTLPRGWQERPQGPRQPPEVFESSWPTNCR